jgi:hypothetical protein
LVDSALLAEQFRQTQHTHESIDLPPSSKKSPFDKHEDNLGLMGIGETIKLSAHELQVLRHGYEKIMSAEDGTKVRIYLKR